MPTTAGPRAVSYAASTPAADSIRQWKRYGSGRAGSRAITAATSVCPTTFGTWMPATPARPPIASQSASASGVRGELIRT
jgi:hypothetical protein